MVSLRFKYLKSDLGHNGFSIGFQRDHVRTQWDFKIRAANIHLKTSKHQRKFQSRIFSMDVFGFAEHQETAT